MGYGFNAITGQFDLVSASAILDGEVETWADLPQTVGDPPVGSTYFVKTSTGVWLVNRRQAGIWLRTSNTGVRADDWTYGGDYPVNSVAGKVGNVTLTASDVGAAAANHAADHASAGSDPVFDQNLNTTDSPTFADLSVTGSFDANLFTTNGAVNIQSGALFVDDNATAVEFGVPIQFAAGAEADSRTNLGLGTAATSASTDFVAVSTIDAKGDLLVGTAADTVARLAVGATNGHVLTVDSAEAGGMKWAAASGGGVTGAAASASDVLGVSGSNITGVDAGSADRLVMWDDSASKLTYAATTGGTFDGTTLRWPVELIIACSDETTNLTTGTAKVTFRAPYAFTLTGVRASVNTAPTGSTLIVDINEGGTSVLSTKLSIDASEKTSTTAASAAVISDSSIADDAEITVDIDQIGSTVAGNGLKVTLIGTRA